MSGVTKRFPGTVALQDVSIDLRSGEVHAMCGENGAGKSTLIKIISGLWPHGSYEGELEVGGSPARFQGIHDAEQAGIAVIYQELALVPGMTVAENIFLGHEPRRGGRLDWNAMLVGARDLLARHALQVDPQAVVGELGVGQQQLVEIVKALARNSKILLLDEPTAALTETEADILLHIIEGLRARGIGCFYISHRLPEVFRIADRITVLRDGRSVSTRPAKGIRREEVIRDMVGRDIHDFFPRRAAPPGVPLLAVDGLSVASRAQGPAVLHDISFSVRAGEVLGIGGLMGSGRTELLTHLFGAYGRRIGGRVQLKGKPWRAESPAQAIRDGVVLVTEDRKARGLVLEQSIGFNQSLSSLGQFTRFGLLQAPPEWVRNQQLMKALAVKAAHPEVAVNSLSGGNQQKVVLAKAMMSEPAVFLLDEPTRGIDVGAKIDVYELINRLTDDGHAVIMVSSELPELMGMSDRILMMSEGRVGGVFARGAASAEQLMAAAMAAHEPQAAE
ncbi:MAG TPA: sugar ABC transporter ATP-binding protein [Kiritimatiellia bacterium]|nr:sugar ABC transporter ATP-binding protein [Kiritimatiellia bacterium]